MNFDEYVRAVEEGNYPEDPKVPAEAPFLNGNGAIRNIAFGAFGGIALIESTPRSIRSNHYHKTDWHYLLVVEGIVHYYYRPAGSKAEPTLLIARPGDVFFTPPMMEHAVFTPTTSRMVSISRLARRHADHEADLVRVPLLRLEDDKLIVEK